MAMADGRASDSEMLNVVDDQPSSASRAVLKKQDEIIAKLNAVLAAIDGAADGNALNTALQLVDLASVSVVDVK